MFIMIEKTRRRWGGGRVTNEIQCLPQSPEKKRYCLLITVVSPDFH